MTTWYVRPRYGSYGNEDGTTYADAWDGLWRVVWGGGGVVAGDTLYICGFHHRLCDSTDVYRAIDLVDGSDGNIVTLRGDYPGDAGIVWGGGLIAWDSWSSEGSNTYSITMGMSHYNDWIFEDVTAETWTILDKKGSIQEVKDNAGSFYAATWGSSDTLYVHCSDDGAPTNRITINRSGFKFGFTNREYITVSNLTFYMTYRFVEDNQDIDHITFDGCTMGYGESYAFWLHEDTTYVTVNDCTIHDAGNGIYAIAAGNDAMTDGTFTNNTIYNMGVRTSQQGRDAHGIGIMGGDNVLVSGNEIYNCGTGVTLYAYETQVMTNHIIRYNYIHDNHALDEANNRGIELNCNANSLSDKSGNKVYGNIVTNCDIAYRIQLEDEVLLYNNVAYGCDTSFASNRSFEESGGPNVKARNNISADVTSYHVFYSTASANGVCDYDYNIYDDDTGTLFRYGLNNGTSDYNFTDWKTNSSGDANSAVDDPDFVNANGDYSEISDFDLESESPCIDAGDWITTITTASDTNTVFDVADGGWFRVGDEIQVDGQSTSYTISAISTNEITTDAAVTWVQNDSVFYQFYSTAPDIGRYEFPVGDPDPDISVYYVDADADNGGDGSTSATTGAHCALDTIADVNALSLNPDDFVLFEKSDTWAEILTIPDSGTSGHPITFGAYGSGSAPKIDGGDARAYCIDGNSKDYITIESIAVEDGTTADILLSGANCIISSVTSTSGVIGFSVTGNSNSVYSCTISVTGGNAILVGGTSNLIYKNNITTSTAEAIDITGNTNSIYYNLLHSNSDDSIVVTGTGATIYNNVIYDSGVAGLDADESCIFRNNIIHTSTGDDINVAANKTVTGGYNSLEDAAKAGTGTYTDTGTSTLFSTDPLMTNPGSDDFTLQVGSPCIERGIVVDLTTDYVGNLVPTGYRPDIGAYEHKGGSNALFF